MAVATAIREHDLGRGVAALTDEQLHTLVDRLLADDPEALKVAGRLVAAGRGGKR